MKAQRFICFTILTLLLVSVAGCSRGRSDAQITADVQAKVNADAQLAGRQVAVQTNNGVVVLSGDVASDLERTTA